MIQNPYAVGDRVLASRAEDGENHEEAKVVDAYGLIIGGDEWAMVAVEFGDGQRSYLRADGADIRPLPEPDDDEAAPGGGDPAG
jgi:hypothetical protein